MLSPARLYKRGTVCAVVLALLFFLNGSQAQSVAGGVAELKALHEKVALSPCGNGGRLVGNGAVPYLLANKIGTYLSQFTDLSFYKNNITFDASDGTFSVNHNLHQPSGQDTAIRSFLVIGARANVTDAFAAAVADKPFRNRLGFTVKQTWLSRSSFYFDCAQKKEMDAERALLLQTIVDELQARTTAFEKNLKALQSSDVPGQDIEKAKEALRKKFVNDLREASNQQFALAQAKLLLKVNTYKKFRLNWTSASIYVPVVRQQFLVAKTTAASVVRQYSYPVEAALHHTRFFEWGAKGRLFLTASATVFQNNSVQSGRLAENNNHYVGEYRNFFTPALKGQAVFFPPDSHIGISAQAEQNLGEYNALNFVLGIPVVLIDKETFPSATFHFLLKYADVGNKVFPGTGWRDKLSVGMTLGVPFSKIVY